MFKFSLFANKEKNQAPAVPSGSELPGSELRPTGLPTEAADAFETILTRLKNNPGDFYFFDKILPMNKYGKAQEVHLRSRDGTMFVTQACCNAAHYPQECEPFVTVGFIDPEINAVVSFFETDKKSHARKVLKIIWDCEDFLHTQALEAKRGKAKPLTLAEPVKPNPSTGDLCARILAMPDEELSVTDALSAMQFGYGLCRIVAEASSRFLEASIGAHNRFQATNAALKGVTQEIKEAAQAMKDQDGGKTVSFEETQRQIKALRGKVTGAVHTCLENFRDAAQSVQLFEACGTALTALREKGKDQLDLAQERREGHVEDLEQSLQTLQISAISAVRYQATAKLAADAERRSVHALKQLGNTLPTLESQIVAALAIERQAMTADMGNGTAALLSGGDAILEQTRQTVREKFLEAARELDTAVTALTQAQQAVIKTGIAGNDNGPGEIQRQP